MVRIEPFSGVAGDQVYVMGHERTGNRIDNTEKKRNVLLQNRSIYFAVRECAMDFPGFSTQRVEDSRGGGHSGYTGAPGTVCDDVNEDPIVRGPAKYLQFNGRGARSPKRVASAGAEARA
jgi:hypothetical protein